MTQEWFGVAVGFGTAGVLGGLMVAVSAHLWYLRKREPADLQELAVITHAAVLAKVTNPGESLSADAAAFAREQFKAITSIASLAEALAPRLKCLGNDPLPKYPFSGYNTGGYVSGYEAGFVAGRQKFLDEWFASSVKAGPTVFICAGCKQVNHQHLQGCPVGELSRKAAG